MTLHFGKGRGFGHGNRRTQGIAAAISSGVWTGQDILLIQYGQSNVGSQGTQGQTPPAAHSALSSNTNFKMWNADTVSAGVVKKSNVSVANGGPGGFVSPAWEAYSVNVNSNPVQNPSTQTAQFYGREAQLMEFVAAKAASCRVALIKYGPGGAQLYDDAGSTPCLLPGATLNGTKHWDTFFKPVALAGIADGSFPLRPGYLTIFLYDQGETDAQDATKSAAYAANGQTLVNAINSVFAPDLIIINQMFGSTRTGLAPAYPYAQAVRDAHAATATYAGTKGRLVDDQPAWSVATSGVHYDQTAIDGKAGTAARAYSVLAAPDVSVAGSISGTAQVGQTLTYTPATWTYTASTTFAYQWKADGAAIGGATSTTYSPGTGDIGKVITVTETATTPFNNASATCTGTSAVIAAPAEDSATTALVNAAVAAGGSAPDSTRRAAVDALIAGLKSDGIWTKLTALEIIAGHDETFSQMEWKGATKKVAIFHGTPTFVTDRGYTLNGTDQSLDTGLNPTTLGCAQNSVGFSLWIAAGTGTTAAVGVNGAVAQRFLFNKGGSGALSLQCSAAAAYTRSATGAPARATHHSMRRTVSTSIDYLNNGSLDTSAGASTSGSVQNTNILLGQTGTTPTYVADRYFSVCIDDGTMTNTDYANLHSRLSTYKTTLGA